jgi:hypothetical protein
MATTSEDNSQYFSSRISPDIVLTLELYITYDEIKKALFFIPNDTAPDPDGYTSLFFKRS